MSTSPVSSELLKIQDLTVSFDGFKALNKVSLSVMPLSINVLIGPNGAGKSTLCDCIIGKIRPAEGRVIYQGKDITKLNEYKITQAGICRKFQAPGVLERLSVYDNLAVAVRGKKGWYQTLGLGKPQQEKTRIAEVLDLIGLSERSDVQASYLAHGEKQWLEIGMVVAQNPALLLLDEPTAGMTAQETAKTAELIKRLAQDHTILVIDHDMTFVELLAAPVTVLHQGQVLKAGSLEEVRSDPEVISVYLGRAADEVTSANAKNTEVMNA